MAEESCTTSNNTLSDKEILDAALRKASVKLNRMQDFAHRVLQFADYAKCIKFLEEHHEAINYDTVNAQGCTLLMTACAYGREDMVEYLSDRTTNITATTHGVKSHVVHFAVRSESHTLLLALFSYAPASVSLINVPNSNGDTPLMMACCMCNGQLIEMLLSMKADANMSNTRHLTALMCLLNQENPDKFKQAAVIPSLLTHCSDTINNQNRVNGDTALHLAIKANNLLAVKFFSVIPGGIDIQTKNNQGLNALELSTFISDTDPNITEILQNMWDELEERSAQQALEILEAEVKVCKKKKTKKKTKKRRSIVESKVAIMPKNDDVGSDCSSASDRKTSLSESSKNVEVLVNDDDDDEWVTVGRGAVKQRAKPPQKKEVDEKRPCVWNNNISKAVLTGKDASLSTVTQDSLQPKAPWSIPKSAKVADPGDKLVKSSSNISKGSIGRPVTTDCIYQKAIDSFAPLLSELDVSVQNFLGLDLEVLSIAQLEAVGRGHLEAYQRVMDVKASKLKTLESFRD